MKQGGLLVVALALLVAACGAAVNLAGDEPAGAGVPAAESARQVLAQRLGVPVGDVTIASAEAVEWGDACLGIPRIDTLCAAVVTPGYRVALLAGQDEYVFHTDAQGTAVELASGPGEDVADPLVEWTLQGADCRVAHIGAHEVAAGACDASLVVGPFAGEHRAAELARFAETYAPFTAQTAAGDVTFRGAGAREATEAEQRMLAEWARLVAQEAEAGRGGASWGLAIGYHAEGGMLGACEDVAVYVSGDATATACGEVLHDLGREWLAPEDLATLYAWVDEYAPFEYERDERAADGLLVRLVFTGAGDAEADEATQQRIADFARDLYAWFEAYQD